MTWVLYGGVLLPTVPLQKFATLQPILPVILHRKKHPIGDQELKQ